MAIRELSQREIEALLERERIVRVAFRSGLDVHLVALGYLWHQGALLGMTTAGRKIEWSRANPVVTFQVDDSSTTGPYGWSSVMGQGRYEEVADPLDAQKIAALYLPRFADAPDWARREREARWKQGVYVMTRLVPSQMSGRANLEPGH